MSGGTLRTRFVPRLMAIRYMPSSSSSLRGLVGLLVEPFLADGVADLAGHVVVLALDGTPFHVAGLAVRQEALDRDDVGRPRIVDLELGAVSQAVIHDDDRVRLQFRDPVIVIDAVTARQHAGNIDPHLGDLAVARQEFLELRGLEVLVGPRVV